jgi:hypothetical protein
MPFDANQLKNLQSYVDDREEFKKENASPPDFGVPTPPKAKSTDEQLSTMPNADKLTSAEKWVYGKLPGVTTWMDENKILGRTISEQLDNFNKGWMGKALNFLDIGSEGLERFGGLYDQISSDPDFNWDELQSAWYAGSLTYDTSNLPQVSRDKDGKVTYRIPTDLPGTPALHEARAKIQTYIDQGMEPRAAMLKAQDEYYNGLGALAIRAQMQDTFFHMLGDPINVLSGALKPLEALKARRFAALTTKVVGGAEEFLAGANKTADLVKGAKTADEALKLADEAYQLAQLAGDSKLAAKYAGEASKIAEGLGKADDVGRYTAEASRLVGMSAEEAASFSEDALRAAGRKQLNSVDKFAIMMTGGDPFRPSALGKKLANVPVLGKVAKAFQLTPESKAREILTLVSDNIGSNVIGRMMTNPNAEADFVSYMRRVANGATGIEYGHGMMTLEGRTVQGFLKGTEVDIERMFATYTELAPTRGRLQLISDTLGESPEKLLRLMDETPEAVLKMVQKYAPTNPQLTAMLQNGELTADALKAISKSIGDLPYNKEMFFAQAMDAIETAAMRQAVVQFGVKAKGALTRWSSAIKAAESLAFLKLNPGYPIRNAINNEVTLLARGLFGHMSQDAVDNFWKGFGTVPQRLGKAELAQDIAGTSGKMKEADRILADALKGGNYGTPEKVSEFFQKINLGKADFAGYWGQKLESYASQKAFTMGTQQYLRRYFKPEGARKYLPPKVMDAIAEMAPGFERELDNAIRASGAMEGKFDALLGTNLNLNIDSILDDVATATGQDARALLGDEVLEVIHQGLPDAIAKGKVDSFIASTRQKINEHIEDLFSKQLENVVEHTKAQAAAGGPNVWNRKLGEAQDLFWGAHIEYSQRMPEATRLAREASSAGDFAAARALWAKEAEDGRQFYNRAFRRVDAYIDGLEQGTKHLADQGVKLPFTETKRTFQKWKGMWEEFHTGKNKLIEDFFADPKGKSFDDVQKQLDTMYSKAIEQEDAFAQTLDDTIAAMIPDEGARSAYMNARDALAELRRVDKSQVATIRKEIADLPKEERQARWNEFWRERAARYQEMRSVDAASVMIQQGDEAATQAFASVERETAEGEAFNIFSMANEYGIASATPEGKRNNKRILDTVNKYAPKEEAIKQADDVASVTAKEATQMPRGELPPEISSRFEQEANRLLDELNSGTGPQVSAPRQGEGGQVVNIPSTNVDWYRDLPKNLQNKKTLNTALEKIIKDKGSDKGVTVERVKDLIIDRWKFGDTSSGTPPDMNMLQQLGADDKALNEALDAYNDITRQSLSLEEAIEQSGGTVDRLTDAARPYFDETGNLVTPQTKVTKYTRVEDIPEDVARAAFEARAQAKGIKPLKTERPAVTPSFIADVNKVIPDPAPIDFSLDLMAYGRQYGMLDEIAAGAKTAAQKAPTMLNDLPAELQDEVQKAVRQIKNDFSSTRYQAMKFGEWRRDSALLNYNRRTNFDNMLGHFAPFVFWSTSSMFQWAVESIDRPAMFTNYLRSKKFLATAGLERDGMASRTKGKIRVELPFAPDWMGEQFIDPMRLALPFDNWAAPFEQWQKDQEGAAGRTERVLDQLLAEGKISQEDYDGALESKQGATWDYAESMMQQNDESDRYDAWDFGTAMASPHAPIMWAYNAAFGDKQDIGPFSPLSRIMRNTATMMGVEDWNNSKWNLEAKVRRQMGLPAYDKWDDYRIDRSLSNLAGDGSFTPDEVKEGMAISALVQSGKMDPEQAKQQSEAYREAVKRSYQEQTGGGAAFALGLLGISVTSVPQGENNLRTLQDDFGNAYAKYKNANDSLEQFLESHRGMDEQEAAALWEKQNPTLAKEGDALTDFFDKYPEYETRLGLFDKPEDKFKKFMIDEVWKHFNELPKVNQDEVRDHLGQEFQDAFMNKETRDYDAVPSETLSVWLKMMNVDPLGGLTADQRMLVNLYGKVSMTDPELANRVQVFYDTRNAQFPEFYKTQSEYYKLTDKAQKSTYLREHPELQQYWTYRSNFMRDNPDATVYLTDDPKAIERAKSQTRNPDVAIPTAQEVQVQLDPDTNELLYGYFQSGEQLPSVVMRELEYIGNQQGLTGEQLLNIVGGGYGVR